MSEIIIYALLSGIGIALVTGPLGCFIVWRKMAYFGDTLSHSTLLGVAFGFLFDLNPHLSVIICSLLFAMVLICLQQNKHLPTDTLLGILAHSTLSLGLVVLSLTNNVRIDMMTYLFGDILATDINDLYLIYGGGIIILSVIILFWRQFLSISIHEELSQIDGLHPKRLQLILIMLIATVIAVAMKIVGALLVTALLIIPAATAQKLSRSPELMAFIAIISGILGVIFGIGLSWVYDTPATPSIILCCFLLFLFSQFKKSKS